jgi:tetratricopeptide (TPR) repeat protein
MDFSTNPVVVWVENAVDWAIHNKTKVLQGVAGLVVLGVGVAVYRYIAHQTNMAAHKELVQLTRIIEEPLRLSGEGASDLRASLETEKWGRVAEMAGKDYQEFKGTKIGATFLALQADALNNLGKGTEAVAAMRQAVRAMSVAAVHDYYQLKLALMLMDAADKAAKQEGLELLTKITTNPKHTAHDRALYYLGEYFWVNKQYAQAKNSWQQFVVKYGTEKSLFELVEKTKERLELLAI